MSLWLQLCWFDVICLRTLGNTVWFIWGPSQFFGVFDGAKTNLIDMSAVHVPKTEWQSDRLTDWQTDRQRHTHTHTMCGFTNSHLTLRFHSKPNFSLKNPRPCATPRLQLSLVVSVAAHGVVSSAQNLTQKTTFDVQILCLGSTWFWKWQIYLWTLHIFWYIDKGIDRRFTQPGGIMPQPWIFGIIDWWGRAVSTAMQAQSLRQWWCTNYL